MSTAYEAAIAQFRFVHQMAIVTDLRPWLRSFMFKSHEIAMNMYLLLEIHRTSVLKDALDQLVGRELRECIRPLKVKFLDVGEEGIDHGGVQQEFFRILWDEAIRGDYGCFVTDDRTRISWFSIVTLEPLHKFELLGLLVGLAIYNGVTLPVSFPLVLYRKLLGWPVDRLEDIEDGWPDLVKGLRQLVNWEAEDGDVADIFVRSYEFGYEAFGKVLSVDISKVGPEDRWTPVRIEKPVVQVSERLARTSSGDFSGQANGVSDPDDFSNVINQEHLQNASSSTEPHRPSEASLIDTQASSAQTLSGSPSRRNSADQIDANDEAAATWRAYHKHQASSTSIASSTTPAKITSDHFLSDSLDSDFVTNANRKQYVKDYIFWLTDKSIRPQFEAFDKGFHAVLDSKSLSVSRVD
jgi:hypothetical protein